MTRVSTAASAPRILHISTARALQTAARERSSRKTWRRLSPSFEGSEASSQSISLQLRESWKEEEDACQQFLAFPSPHELREMSVHFQSLHIAVCRQAAPVATFAGKCCLQLLQGLASHELCFQCTQTFFLWQAFGHLYQFSHSSTSASLQDTWATCGFLLLLAAVHETSGPVRNASCLAECVKGALWRGLDSHSPPS